MAGYVSPHDDLEKCQNRKQSDEDQNVEIVVFDGVEKAACGGCEKHGDDIKTTSIEVLGSHGQGERRVDHPGRIRTFHH